MHAFYKQKALVGGFSEYCTLHFKHCQTQLACLPERDLLDEGIILALHELLDGDEVAGVPRPALVHHPVTALADLAQLLVPEEDLDNNISK